MNHKHKSWYLLIVIFFAVGLNTYGQSIFDEFTATFYDQVYDDLHSILNESDHIDLRLLLPKGDYFCTKNTDGNRLMCDSISEYLNMGYDSYTCTWHYWYDSTGQIDSITGVYFDENNQLKQANLLVFNKECELDKLIIRKKQTNMSGKLIDYYRQENTWEGGKLVHRKYSEYASQRYLSREEYFAYDEAGKLTYDSMYCFVDFSSIVRRYRYDLNDNLFGIVTIDPKNQSFIKYIYENTDTTRTTISFNISYPNSGKEILLDTINQWEYEKHYHEIYNEAHQRVKLMVKTIHKEMGEQNNYQCLFTQTESNKLETATYYIWAGNMQDGRWAENNRIKINYGEAGYPVNFEKTFYDGRKGNWELEKYKSYYYSRLDDPLAAAHQNNKGIFLYPNPADGYIFINLSLQPTGYQIYNYQGQKLFHSNGWSPAIDVSILQPGLYFLELIIPGENRMFTFVKE